MMGSTRLRRTPRLRRAGVRGAKRQLLNNVLLIAKGDDGIDAHGAAGGNVAGGERDERQ
jgi:hypothetical protein